MRPATVKPVDELIRFVVGAGRRVVPDLKRKLPGRGVWVTATATALRRGGRAQGVFARGFKREVAMPPDLVADRSRRLLERAALDALALANKAGLVVAGLRQGRGGARRGEAVGARSMPPSGRRTACASSRGAAPQLRRSRRNRRRRCFCSGAIGFGIGAVKCDTCCRSRAGLGERDVS